MRPTFLDRNDWRVQHIEARDDRTACGTELHGVWSPRRADVPISTKPICAHCVRVLVTEMM